MKHVVRKYGSNYFIPRAVHILSSYILLGGVNQITTTITTANYIWPTYELIYKTSTADSRHYSLCFLEDADSSRTLTYKAEIRTFDSSVQWAQD